MVSSHCTDHAERLLTPHPGIQAPVTKDGSVKYSWFRTEFDVPGEWNDERVQLNFDAVDYEATVYVNVSASHASSY